MKQALEALERELRARLDASASALVKPAPFEYFRPRSLDEALALLAEHGRDAKPLAGGQSLIPAMNFRLATPAVLVDLNAHRRARRTSARRRRAAHRRHDAASHARAQRRSSRATRRSSPQRCRSSRIAAIRTRGTIGGSLAHADPAAELPAVMLALDATFTLRSRERRARRAGRRLLHRAVLDGARAGRAADGDRDPARGRARSRLRVRRDLAAARRLRAGRRGRARRAWTATGAARARASRC